MMSLQLDQAHRVHEENLPAQGGEEEPGISIPEATSQTGPVSFLLFVAIAIGVICAAWAAFGPMTKKSQATGGAWTMSPADDRAPAPRIAAEARGEPFAEDLKVPAEPPDPKPSLPLQQADQASQPQAVPLSPTTPRASDTLPTKSQPPPTRHQQQEEAPMVESHLEEEQDPEAEQSFEEPPPADMEPPRDEPAPDRRTVPTVIQAVDGHFRI